MKIMKNVDMSRYTTFRAGGKADEMVIPETAEELVEALNEIKEKKVPYTMLGNGSNTLVTDGGFHGTVIKLGERFNSIQVNGSSVSCGSGALMSSVAKAALAADLAGFEFASGIPGSIGGAVFMNAGAYGGEMKDIVVSATVIDGVGGDLQERLVDDMDLSYRHSAFQNSGDIITQVNLCLTKGEHADIAERMRELAEKRNSKQPVQYPSAGSFFKRPEGYFAGKLVQDAGLKGLTVGGAQVSELHSGFIINRGGATATDIIQLMHLVQNTVYDKFGVKLEP
ncbi:UDP-N-acetylmuramate dehydrogenase, partial [Aminicella lysinilytica]|uniref:UDP-N-acetylmuramate dehydrogenase n=1 Tax=Aminicella lysinilytica TaxID=433323 RepID=UPI0026F368EA